MLLVKVFKTQNFLSNFDHTYIFLIIRWSRVRNPEPWQRIGTNQQIKVKFFFYEIAVNMLLCDSDQIVASGFVLYFALEIT